jgi:predicted pyridoxine 5'-phosphate oxidase superfamily flavin-nucleotide-binding protein
MERRKKIFERVPSSEKPLLLQKFLPFLSKGKFVNVATCNNERMPNVSPKLVAKLDKNMLYLVDYVMGSTYVNIKENPRVSLSFVDERTLTGYQLNGTATVMESGLEYVALVEEFHRIQTDFTVERILSNVRSGGKSDAAAVPMPDRFAVLKVRIIEIVEITSSGHLKSRYTI